jgi:hypothetical protein
MTNQSLDSSYQMSKWRVADVHALCPEPANQIFMFVQNKKPFFANHASHAAATRAFLASISSATTES